MSVVALTTKFSLITRYLFISNLIDFQCFHSHVYLAKRLLLLARPDLGSKKKCILMISIDMVIIAAFTTCAPVWGARLPPGNGAV